MNHLEEETYWGHIWEKFRKGDRLAFDMIYNEYIDALFAYGCRLTTHRELVQDAIQDMFLDVYKYGKQLRKQRSLEFYMYQALKRNIIHKLKENNRFIHPENIQEHFDLKFPLEILSFDDMDDNLLILKKELTLLDTKRRELLFLKFNSGLTYNEIGNILDTPPDTVKKQVLRILKLLRKKMNAGIVVLLMLVLGC